MRVLLVNRKTGLYYQSQGSWTLDPEAAVDFGGSIKSGSFALEQGVEPAEICWITAMPGPTCNYQSRGRSKPA